MGESFLAGTEYKDYNLKEKNLEDILQELINSKWQVSLKNDEITVLVEAEITVTAVIRRENRIEAGHLTLDDIYFELANDGGFKIFFSLVQYRKIEKYSGSFNFRFDSYWWSFRRV
ncbi:hypothetical protein JCM15765_44510 [Paradesulfitobacterium aromaticivorans]